MNWVMCEEEREKESETERETLSGRPAAGLDRSQGEPGRDGGRLVHMRIATPLTFSPEKRVTLR